ncbi:MAG: TIM barrel protein [Spirochaetales bacterium]|nr:TIM barrel protein [Candidatus Physcosoma equi]
MAVTRSLILNALVPESVLDEKVFRESLEILQKTKVKAIEFYAPFDTAVERNHIMRDMGFGKTIYLIAGRQKGERKWLNALDEVERQKAMDLTKEALEVALKGGYNGFLITSGAMVEEAKKEASLDQLERSIEELYAICGRDIDMYIEPGDTTVDACQLIGPIGEAAAFAERIRNKNPNFYLTLDTSHIAQLGERFDSAFALGKATSNHLHLASCILKKDHPFYGDKHPLFSNPDGVYTSNALKHVMNRVVAAYEEEGRDLTVGVEIIDRSGKRMGSLEEAMAESPWFFME